MNVLSILKVLLLSIIFTQIVACGGGGSGSSSVSGGVVDPTDPTDPTDPSDPVAGRTFLIDDSPDEEDKALSAFFLARDGDTIEFE